MLESYLKRVTYSTEFFPRSLLDSADFVELQTKPRNSRFANEMAILNRKPQMMTDVFRIAAVFSKNTTKETSITRLTFPSRVIQMELLCRATLKETEYNLDKFKEYLISFFI